MSSGFLSDDLLRQLMAVGQVDVLVGIPTYNSAGTLPQVLEAVHVSFSTHFARERTLVLTSDGGSEDGTIDIIREFRAKSVSSGSTLRTQHRIAAPTHGLPGKLAGVRTFFTAGDLLQTKALVVLDPEVTSLEPEWIERLARPVHREGIDFVAPIYPRDPLDGAVVTQLVRPLFRAVYGRRLHEPLCAEFGCSSRFAGYCLENLPWEPSSFANVRLAADAAAFGFRLGQAHLGVRETFVRKERPRLPEIFLEIIGPLLGALEVHANQWSTRQGSEEVAAFGEATDPPPSRSEMDPSSLQQSFRSGVHDLEHLLKPVLATETLGALIKSADAPTPQMPDPLWAMVIYEFAAAHHRMVMSRDHLVQALVPLYLGRLSAWIDAQASEPTTLDVRQEGLCQAFERMKPHLLECWGGPAR